MLWVGVLQGIYVVYSQCFLSGGGDDRTDLFECYSSVFVRSLFFIYFLFFVRFFCFFRICWVFYSFQFIEVWYQFELNVIVFVVGGIGEVGEIQVVFLVTVGYLCIVFNLDFGVFIRSAVQRVWFFQIFEFFWVFSVSIGIQFQLLVFGLVYQGFGFYFIMCGISVFSSLRVVVFFILWRVAFLFLVLFGCKEVVSQSWVIIGQWLVLYLFMRVYLG